MPEAVIVATARTPIGRANKGSLTECRPDDLAGFIVKTVLEKTPAARPAAGRGRHPRLRPARRRGGLQRRPRRGAARWSARRPRRHRQPLLLVVAADDPHGRPRHQGRRGRRLRGRRRRDREPLHARRVRHRAAQRPLRRRRGAHRPSARTAPTAGSRPSGLPDIYIAMGQTAENVVLVRERHPRGDGRVGRPLAAAGRRRPGARLLRPRDHPRHPRRRHRRVEGRRPPRRHHRREAGRAEAGVPPRRQGHGRQRLPPERRRRRGDRDERHEGQRARHHPARPASCRPASPASTPRSWAWVPSRPAARP